MNIYLYFPYVWIAVVWIRRLWVTKKKKTLVHLASIEFLPLFSTFLSNLDKIWYRSWGATSPSCFKSQCIKWVWNSYKHNYTGCNRRNVRDFGRVFLRSDYIDITQNTYIQSWTVTEIMAGEVWNFDSSYSLIDYQIHIETGRNMWFL